MCGRFSIHLADLSEIGGPLGVTRSGIEVWEPRYNVAPSQLAPVVFQRDGERHLALHHFGLIPHWAKDRGFAARTINARVETVASKPAFRDAFARTRCIVPVTGYFEWQSRSGGHKQAMWIHPAEGAGSVLWLAGLRARWQPPASAPEAAPSPTPVAASAPEAPAPGPAIESFCILTQASQGAITDIHDRMPVDIPAPLVDRWLHGRGDTALRDALTTANPAPVRATPVGTWVNAPRHDDARCITPEAARANRQLSLF